jgi:hypothetical protein
MDDEQRLRFDIGFIIRRLVTWPRRRKQKEMDDLARDAIADDGLKMNTPDTLGRTLGRCFSVDGFTRPAIEPGQPNTARTTILAEAARHRSHRCRLRSSDPC